jgi:dipeptidyl aminopeptidase/acylaminoacyl peptidase
MKKQLKLNSFKDYKFISGLHYSPNGDYLSYQIHESQENLKDYDSNIWITDLKTNSHKQFTTSNQVKGHQWLPETNQVIYPSSKDEKILERIKKGEPLTAYYVIDPLGGESKKYMEIPISVTKLIPLSDQKFLLTGKYFEFFDNFHLLSDEEKKSKLDDFEAEQDYEVIEEIPFWSNGGSYNRKGRNRLYIFDSVTCQLTSITEAKMQVDYFDVKDHQVVFTGKSYENKMPLTNKLFIYDLKKKTTQALSDQDLSIRFAYFLDEDHLAILASDRKTYGLNQNPIFYKINIQTHQRTSFASSYDKSSGSSVGSDCRLGGKRQFKALDGHLYFVTTEEENAPLNHLSPSGELTKLTNFSGSVDDLDIHEGRVAFIGMIDQNLNEIFLLEDQKEKRITDFNTWVNEAYSIIKPEAVMSTSGDGSITKGWVLKPVDYDSNKSYPSILNIHGGPKTVYSTVFYHEMQTWANEGYFVYFCNPRGSDGRGSEFSDIRGKYGTIDYDDLMAFTDEVLKTYPNMDKNNMFVTGGSYGGFMTNWIVSHTHRFKAAASQRSISNWMTEYGVTDIGYYFVPDQTAADPFDDYEKLWFHSPLKYVKDIQTPLLFIHSDADYRCWIPEALQMFTALKDLGKETKLCIFKKENHELSRGGKPNHRLRRLKEITSWFDQHKSL